MDYENPKWMKRKSGSEFCRPGSYGAVLTAEVRELKRGLPGCVYWYVYCDGFATPRAKGRTLGRDKAKQEAAAALRKLLGL